MLQNSLAIIFYVVAGGMLAWAVYSMLLRYRKKDADEGDPRDYPSFGPGDWTRGSRSSSGDGDGGGDGGGGSGDGGGN